MRKASLGCVDANAVVRQFEQVSKSPKLAELLKEIEAVPQRERLAVVSRTFCPEVLRSRGIPFPTAGRAFTQVSNSEDGGVEVCLKGDADLGVWEVSWDFGCFKIDVGLDGDDDDDD